MMLTLTILHSSPEFKVSKTMEIKFFFLFSVTLSNLIPWLIYFQGDPVKKVVFTVFFQGEQLKSRVKKICEGYVTVVVNSSITIESLISTDMNTQKRTRNNLCGVYFSCICSFRATLYPCPDSGEERRNMAGGIGTRLEDLNTVSQMLLFSLQELPASVIIKRSKYIWINN